MLILKRSFLVLITVLALYSCGKAEPLKNNPSEGDGKEGGVSGKKDTIEYRAQVWVDKADMERYGGERFFKNNLKQLFRNSTRFWNESPNKFNHYYRFVAGEELKIYDIQGNKADYDKFKNEAFDDLDITKYDYVVFFALDADKTSLSCGGGGKSGQSVVMAYLPRTTNIFTDAEYPNQGTYSNLAHEYGHVRGAQDLYQYKISAANNRVSDQAFIPPACNMGTGYMVWSDFCSALFNYTANQKQLEKNLHSQIFPENLLITVKKNGAPVENVTVNFYGTRAGGYWGGPDVYDAEGNSPYLAKKTNSSGQISISNVYKMFIPNEGGPGVPPKNPKDEFPYSRWYCFLMEIKDGQSTTYMWLSDLDICQDFLEEGNKTYQLNINLQ